MSPYVPSARQIAEAVPPFVTVPETRLTGLGMEAGHEITHVLRIPSEFGSENTVVELSRQFCGTGDGGGLAPATTQLANRNGCWPAGTESP